MSVFINFRSKLLNLMSVKTFILMIFREVFLTLTSPELIFVKSVSGMTQPPYFLSQLKLIYLAALYANYWCYDFEARIFIFFFSFKIIFLIILVPFGIATHYPISDYCFGLEKTLEGSYIKVSEKSLCFERLRHFLLALFYLIFGFCQFLLLFIVNFLL